MKSWISAHPELPRSALFLTESGSLFKLALGFTDILPLTLHHYLFTADEQRATDARQGEPFRMCGS